MPDNLTRLFCGGLTLIFMKRMIFLLTISLLLAPFSVTAETFHGKIVKTKGEVFIKNKNGVERAPKTSDYIAITDEEINTHNNGKAVVKFTNGSITVLGENSTLGIEKPTLFSHLRGKILFAYNKIAGPSRMVRTNSAVFGVRATSFIVHKGQDGDLLALKEGLVNVEAPTGSFEIHKKKEAETFSDFVSGIESGVDVMKKEGDAYIQQINDEYVAYKKSFLLHPDNVIRINGNRVDESPMGESLKSDFSEFEDFAGEFLDSFRE